MSAPNIHRDETETKGRYWLVLDGHEAELTYSRAGEDRLIADHTGVPKALGGRGIGRMLVERLVADARAEGRKIVPLCPFIKAQIDKTPEWQDVLDKS
ncbi:GNAT family N-acetyltransferase [Parvularcula marina]|uniref:GNAT family N-acetyltransferase n=1 Tax=Parvularcula marina TaxID=2292771 RepID=UPI003519A3C2